MAAQVIPVLFKDSRFAHPEQSIYYVVAGNGVYLAKNTPLFSSVTETSSIAGLRKHCPSLTLRFPKIPRTIMESVYGFFDWASRTWKCEALVFLYVSIDKMDFKVAVPPQTVHRRRSRDGWETESRVEYTTVARPEGFLKLGDVHSHDRAPAFFSHTDDLDDQEDGLRIVFGSLDLPRPEVLVSFITGGTRFQLDPGEVFEGFCEAAPPPADWMRQITCQVEEPCHDRVLVRYERE